MPTSSRPPGPLPPGSLKVAIAKELRPGEKRVAATPTAARKLAKLGFEVLVQAGAGDGASFVDGDYAEVGARVVADPIELFAAADVVLKVQPPGPIAGTDQHEVDLYREGVTLVGFVWPAQNKELVERLQAKKATVLAMDAVPRITRAQKMDALSAMANVAGYRAVIEAAAQYGRFVPGQMTAAGRSKPAQVLVVGAGVAGLAAIAAARSLGAVVRAFDTRPQVREQVESLGARFLEFSFDESGEGEGGYARAMSDEYLAAEQALIGQHCEQCDIVITTALIPGMTAPQLVTSGAVVAMPHGSVIVDLAAEQGGNCALTERDRIVSKFGVTIVGLTDMASRMALQASELYATTVYNLVADVTKAGKGPDEPASIVVNLEDEVHRGAIITKDGKILWPPPTKPKPRAGGPLPAKEAAKHAPPPPPDAGPARTVGLLILASLFVIVGLVAPPSFLEHFTVFLLACVVGWHVVWNVTPALHTPLMSVTNAISGIIVLGGMLLVLGAPLGPASILGVVAILLASINVAGGFLVTQRMLRMFRR